MNTRIVALGLLAALAAGVWLGRERSPMLHRAAEAVGLPSGDLAPPPSLSESGVHKCRSGGGIVYLDRPCPAGSRELSANGGTVSVMAFPKAAPSPASAGASAAALVHGLSQAEIDRMRDQQIDAAANR